VAAVALGNLGTHTAQRALVDFAGQSARPSAARRAAASALADSVRRFGVQLTIGEIESQYDRYNRSRDLGPAEQQALAAVLDALETRVKP
jgi:hypothetical protein